ncbi:hypothetical protein RR48_13288 [Papilio machaon]|uniref:Uncharacterized protein n=1 Tax=Papilio machaon TaxID=76193 RepID=A0A194QWH2_PAPMA|nr:hypothetical protein RR48_13288 [Papilio machaon]
MSSRNKQDLNSKPLGITATGGLLTTSPKDTRIAVLILNVYFGYAKPGINIKKQFEVQFNPTPFKSLEFIFEKWSRFGKFGLIRKIAKRDTNDVIDIFKLPSNEKDNLQVLPVVKESGKVTVPAQNLVILSTVEPIQNTEEPVQDSTNKVEIIPVVEPSNEIVEPIEPFLPMPGEQNTISIPAEATTLQPVSAPVPPTAKPEVNSESTPLLYTNILQSLNIPQMKAMNNQIPQTLSPPKLENQNLIVRGSRFAMYFGSMLLRMLSQYLSGGRIPLGNMPVQEVPLL